MQSLLKLNPGLSLIPRVRDDATLIQVTTFDSQSRRYYLDYMEKYLSVYPNESSNCNFETGQRKGITIKEPCEFPRSLLGACAEPATYLQDNGNACFYLKLNKIYGYLPDIEGNKIHVKCSAANRLDREDLGEAQYYPSVDTPNGTMGYFSTVVFPYLNQPNYQTPLLAVVFPNLKRNRVVMISCKVVNMANTEEYRFDAVVDTKPSIALD